MRKFYLRDADRKPYGVVVAVKLDKGVSLGISMANPEDSWDKNLGTMIAEGRAHKSGYYIEPDLCKCLASNPFAASFNLGCAIGELCHSRQEPYELDEVTTGCVNGKVLAKTIQLMVNPKEEQ